MKDSKGNELLKGDSVKVIQEVKINDDIVIPEGTIFHNITNWYNDGQAESRVKIENKYIDLVFPTDIVEKVSSLK